MDNAVRGCRKSPDNRYVADASHSTVSRPKSSRAVFQNSSSVMLQRLIALSETPVGGSPNSAIATLSASVRCLAARTALGRATAVKLLMPLDEVSDPDDSPAAGLPDGQHTQQSDQHGSSCGAERRQFRQRATVCNRSVRATEHE